MPKYSKRPNIPGLGGLPKEIRTVLQPVKQLLDIHEGRAGNPYVDRFVKIGEVSHLINTQVSASNARPSDSEAPDPPTNVQVVAGAWSNRISWTNATNDDLWAVEVFCAVGVNDWTQAEVVATVTIPPDRRGKTSQYVHFPDNILSDHYYWVRSVDYSGNASRLAPPGETDGILAPGHDTLGETIDRIMDALTPAHAPAWDPGKDDYEAGDIVEHDGRQWQCYNAPVPVGAEPGTTGGADYWIRTGILLQGDVDGVPTVGVDGNLVVDQSILGRSIATAQIQVGHIGDTGNILNQYAPSRGVGENVNDWNTYVTGDSTKVYGFQVKIDKANKRVYVRIKGWGDGTKPSLNYAFELEVYGAQILSFTNISFNETIANKGSDVDFGTDNSVWGPNGVVHDESIADTGSDEGYWTLDTLTKDTVFRLKIVEIYKSEASTDIFFTSLGDRTVHLSPPSPSEYYFNAADGEEYDVLRMTNAPAEAGADNTQNQLDLGASIDNAKANGYTLIQGGYINTDILNVDYAIIVGTKPPANADNTQAQLDLGASIDNAKANGYTLIQGGYIATEVLTVGRANIQDLAVDNAKIENLTIGTGKVQNDAISGKVGGYAASSVNLYIFAPGPVLTHDRTIVGTGNSILVLISGIASVSCSSSTGSVEVILTLKRNSTIIWGPKVVVSASANDSETISFSVMLMDDEAISGNNQYTMSAELQYSGEGSGSISERSIALFEFKK